MKTTTKEIAIQNKSKFYFTGKPCKHGHINKRYTKSGLCVSCSKNNYTKFNSTNPNRLKELQQTWYEKNKEKVIQKSLEWNNVNKEAIQLKYQERVEKGFRQRHYGLTKVEIQELLEKANYKCQICKKSETAKTKNGNIKALSIDHCHSTNKVRGVLCDRCNRALGLFLDSLESLTSAVKYLKQE